MKGCKLVFIVLFLLTYNMQYGQNQEDESLKELSLDKGTINSQFEFIFKKSGNFRAEGKKYEVVRTISLDKLRKNVLDTLNGYTKRTNQLKETISGHVTTISSLNNKLEETTNNLGEITKEKDSMSLLGILVSKGAYNSILWTIIASLLGLMLFFLYKFRRSNILTHEAKSNLSELETEYEDHRRRALEREQKISRQLQDEINKHKKAK